INVLERQREIGVMRAVGASNTAVRRIFIAEGLLIGFMSWLIALALAWPLSRLMSDAVGQQVMNAPLDYEFSFVSVLGWLVAVMVLATFSSFWPAWSASRLTVQEVLAYE
ncbi:MAG: FtsX-like permease family protein, partial [Anaerolineales bacterium]|nr:FtsX-like permease family protein [Anaerolineales bacterium]